MAIVTPFSLSLLPYHASIFTSEFYATDPADPKLSWWERNFLGVIFDALQIFAGVVSCCFGNFAGGGLMIASGIIGLVSKAY